MSTEVKKPDKTELRDAIFNLEDYLKTLPQVDITWVHRFTPGLYAREMQVPAGVMMTGAIHKTQHISIFLEGKMIIPDENGGSQEITAPMVEIAQPGIKRVGYAVEDVRWITLHPTEETDVALIEDMIVTNDPNEVPEQLPVHSVTEIGPPQFGKNRQTSAIIDQTEGKL